MGGCLSAVSPFPSGAGNVTLFSLKRPSIFFLSPTLPVCMPSISVTTPPNSSRIPPFRVSSFPSVPIPRISGSSLFFEFDGKALYFLYPPPVVVAFLFAPLFSWLLLPSRLDDQPIGSEVVPVVPPFTSSRPADRSPFRPWLLHLFPVSSRLADTPFLFPDRSREYVLT